MLSIDMLPTKEFLTRRGVQLRQLERSCSWCDREPDSTEHLFFKCKFIEWFWQNIFEWWDVEWNLVDGFLDFYSLCNNVKFTGYGWIKFNVSGVANEDEARCGGMLRDVDGVAKALFLGPVAAKDSIAAEIGAIIIALDVYLVMGWKGKGSLIIEIDQMMCLVGLRTKG
ncbi:hypothetical protein J1N35_028328 [Gossypium stocksii]|uniref:Reverse transcriptase zinc-binding domain-containing protein n=1 Tax=Gossypium stocksii TaxID=47602 RepID=A0A9D3UW11_9ROSI|nr:hypothetical protein J1N35_028328 [Gossypium stocksii]